jgi:hypothetical protein
VYVPCRKRIVAEKCKYYRKRRGKIPSLFPVFPIRIQYVVLQSNTIILHVEGEHFFSFAVQVKQLTVGSCCSFISQKGSEKQ